MTHSGIDALLVRFARFAHEALGMDVAFVSERSEATHVVRAVVGAGASLSLQEGARTPWDSMYCARVVGGELPEIIPNLRENPMTAVMPVTEATGAGAYAGVPIPLTDGTVFGTLCCLSRDPEPTLGPVEQRLLQALGEALGRELSPLVAQAESDDEARARVHRAVAGEGLSMVYQPIVGLARMQTVGVEALARFDCPPMRPDIWFADAARLGLGGELELAAARQAVAAIPLLPPSTWIGINASPAVIVSGILTELLLAHAGRVHLEITEHASVGRYDALLGALAPLRAGGVRLAVDDAGAGYASMRHILALGPEVIKLDRDVVSGLTHDRARAALVGALVTFAEEIGAVVVAEGVETQAELDKLVSLGVPLAQGYFLGRPAALPLPALEAAPGHP